MDTNTKIFIKYALPLIKSVITGDFYENGVEDKIPDISIYSLSEKQIFYEIMLSICDIINFAFVLYQEELDHYGLNILLFPDFIYKYVTLNILPRSNCPKTLHNRIQEIRSIITYIERKNVYIDNKMKDIIKETLTYITHKSSVMITDSNFISKNDSKAFEDLNKKKKMEALISLQDYYNIIRTLFEKINIYIEEINNKKNINDIYIKKFHTITILMMYLLQTCTGCPLRNNDIYNLKLFENLKKYRNENTKKEYIYIIHTGSKNGNIPYSDGKKFPDIYILCEKFQKIYDKYIIIRNQICEYLKDNDIEYTTNLFLYIRKPNTNSNYVASQFTYSTYPTICKHQLKKLFSNIPKDHSGYSYRHCFATWFGRTNCVNPLYCQSFIRSCHHTNDVHDKYYNLNIKYKTIYNNNDFKLNDLCTSELGIKVFIDYVLDKQFAKEMNYFVPERDIDELAHMNYWLESMESKDSAKINNCNNENKYIKLSDQQISPIIISPIIKFNSMNDDENKKSIELISPLLLPSFNSNNNDNNYSINDSLNNQYNLNNNNILNNYYSPIPINNNHNLSSTSINYNNSSNPSINNINYLSSSINNNNNLNSSINNNNYLNSSININNQNNNNSSNSFINHNSSSNPLINNNNYLNSSINYNNSLNPIISSNDNIISSSPNILLNNINNNLANPIISNSNNISFQKLQNTNEYASKVIQNNNQSSANIISANNSNIQSSIKYNIDNINADNIIPTDVYDYTSLSENNDISKEIHNQSSNLSINYSNDNINISSCYNNSQNSQYENDPIQINNKQTYNLIINEKQYYTFLHEGSFPSELFDLYLYLNVYNKIVTTNNINLFIHNYYNYNDFINDSYLYNISYEIQFHFNSNSPIFFIFTIYLKNKDRYYLIINKLTNGDKKKTLTINIYNFFDIEDGNDKYLNQIINQIKKLFKTNTSKIIVQYKKCDKSYDNNNAILIFGMIKQFIKEYNMFQKNIKHIRNLNFDYDNIDLDSEQLNVNKFFLYHLNKEK
ncbi:hypothetical protein WA158_006855 [Blastocystis sp. Blastoise]